MFLIFIHLYNWSPVIDIRAQPIQILSSNVTYFINIIYAFIVTFIACIVRIVPFCFHITIVKENKECVLSIYVFLLTNIMFKLLVLYTIP